jgi:hypothetical protein
MRPLLGFLGCAFIALGCTGLSPGENDPDTNLGTHLGSGEIAVDPITETAFVLQSKNDFEKSRLYAVEAGASSAREVLSLDGTRDPRLLFTAGGVMVMSELQGKEELVMLDRLTFEETGRYHAKTQYWGTRQSANRRWVGVADNNDYDYDLHIIDSTSWETRVIPHGGDWVEAMFGNETDTLFTISIDNDTHRARIMSFDMDKLASNGFAFDSETLTYKNHNLDISVDDVMRDFAFSYTWVGVSPDDKTVVFPVRKYRDVDPGEEGPIDDYKLIVLDVESGTTRTVPRAKGPVGFSPDGSTIVSYSNEGGARLLLIDAESLAVEETTVPVSGGFSFFVSHQGSEVVVAGGHQLVLHDIDSGEQTQMSGPSGSLEEFSVRDTKGLGRHVAGAPSEMLKDPVEQLWIVQPFLDIENDNDLEIDGGFLYVADLRLGAVSEIETLFEPEHINILRARDEIVMTDLEHRALHFFDPVERKEVRTVTLPAL